MSWCSAKCWGNLKDEEEDLYWSQGALEMIEKIGKQNWLFTQV